MLKGSQLILLLLLLLIIGGVSTFLYLNWKQQDYMPAAFAMPESTVMAYQGNKLEEDFSAISQHELFRFLSRNKGVASLNQDFHYFDSLLSINPLFKKSVAVEPLLLSLDAPTSNGYSLLCLHQPRGSFDEADVEDFVKKILPDARVFQHVFESVKIYDVKSGRNTFSYAFPGGILAISRQALAVEDAVSAYNNNRKHNSAFLQKVVDNRTQSKLFINYGRLPRLLGYFTSAYFHEPLEQLSALNCFGTYDWKLDKGAALLNGELTLGDGPNSLWYPLTGQEPQQLDAAKVLPSSTALYMNWGVGNFGQYYTKWEEVLKAAGQRSQHEQDVNALKGQGIDINTQLNTWIGKEWTYAMLEPASDEAKAEPLMIIKPADTATAMQVLHDWNDKIEQQELAGTTPTIHRNYTIARTAFTGAFGTVFGKLFKEFDKAYYTRLGEYVVFAPSVQSVIKCIDANLDKQTLAQLNDYKAFAARYTQHSNFTVYLNPGRATLLAYPYVAENYTGTFKANLPLYKGLNNFGFSLSWDGQKMNSTASLQMEKEEGSAADLLWSLTLDAEPQNKPFIVSGNGNQKDVLVQDRNNQLYLVSNGGSILWKRSLGEPIAGNVEAMDLYKNGQHQYLFATTNKLYLVDHDGHDAGGYPIRLGTPTRTGVALYDFFNNHEYTYYVEGEGNRIYAYNGNGSPLQGWAAVQTDARLSMPLKWFTISQQNYLLGISDKGTLYVWNDKGRAALAPIALKTRFKNPLQFSFGPTLKECSAFSVDTAGMMYYVTLDGSVNKRAFRRFGRSPYFEYFDADGDGKSEYVLAGNKLIAAYPQKDTAMLWKLITSENLSYPPQHLSFGKNTYIGYVNVAANKLYLFRKDGTPFGNFPQRGDTPFSVGDLTGNADLSIVVGGKDKMLYLYRLSR